MNAVSLRPVRNLDAGRPGGSFRFLCYFSLGGSFGLSKSKDPCRHAAAKLLEGRSGNLNMNEPKEE